jgi:hypothetical protein
MKQKYFLVYEISFLSLMAALLFLLKTYLKTPMHFSGHNAILWVIPLIIGLGVTKKFGSATFVGLIGGLLISSFGTGDLGPLSFIEFTAMGITIDILALIFKDNLDNILVGLILGGFGGFIKQLVHFYLVGAMGGTGNAVLAGINSIVIALVFGAAGGAISAIILNRIKHVQFPKKIVGKKESLTEKQKKES